MDEFVQTKSAWQEVSERSLALDDDDAALANRAQALAAAGT
jgi:hypothetical protein